MALHHPVALAQLAGARELAARYTAALAGTGLTPPVERAGDTHVYHQYTVRSPDRASLQERLTVGWESGAAAITGVGRRVPGCFGDYEPDLDSSTDAGRRHPVNARRRAI